MQELQPNDSINNRYTIIRKLGAGAMGSVYLAEDRVEKNIKVALKILISENLEDQDVWAKGEYEALTRLRHPNLAKVFNFGRIEGTDDYFIVSEFIKGLDLFSMTEFVNYAEITEIIVQACRALEYIHSQGYVHFDIKPDNILVTRCKTIGIREGSKVAYDELDLDSTVASRTSKPVVKVIDFGLAEKITGSFSFAIKGTLNYLAPEMLDGLNPDKRADLYSLGVTIYQIVNRDLPFYQGPGDGRVSVSGSPTKRSDLFEVSMKKHPDFLREMILRLIEENPEDRFQSAKEVIQFINKNSEYEFEIETEETKQSYFQTPRLVGRKKEMQFLKRHHELVFFPHRSEDGNQVTVRSGAPERDDKVQLLVVNGEMGSGKSRLLDEFKHWLKLNDLNVYTGNCYEGTQKAYQSIIEILRQVVCGVGLDSEIYRRHEHSISRLLPDVQGGGDRRARDEQTYRPEKEKHQFIDAISQFLVEAAQQVPYLAVVNNLQWVDDASVDLLDRLFRTMEEARSKGDDARLMVIFSQRSEEQAHERARELISDRIDQGFGKEILVRRLKTEQIREFLQAMMGSAEVPEDFVQRLEEQTGGSPLFLVETLKALEDAGVFKHQGEGWTIKTSRYTKVEIPRSVEDLFLERIERLELVKRQILEVMGILNKPVSPKLLQRVERFKDVPVLVQLRDLENLGIVHKRFESNKLLFEIDQAEVREILCRNLEDDDRRQIHGEVGEAYETHFRDRPDEILEELAYHLQRSNKTAKAMEFALRAGDRLKAIYANEKAHGHYTFVLEETEGKPDHLDVYFDIREKLGDICTTMGRCDQAEVHYSELLSERCRDKLAPNRVTNLHLRRGKVFEIQGDYEAALRQYKESRNHLSAFGKDHQVLDRARVFISIGWVYVCMGKYEKAMTISLEALRVIGGLEDGMEHAKVFSTIGSANFFKGNIQEAAKYHRKSLEIKESLENVPEIIVSLNNLGSADLAGAEYGEALESFRRAFATSEEIGDPYGRAMSLHNLARLYVNIGDTDAAEGYLRDSFRQTKLFSMRYLNLQNHIVRGLILKDRQEYAKAEGSFFRVLTAFSKQGNRAGLCSILVEVAELHRLNQNFDEAAKIIEDAKCSAEELGIAPLQVRCLLEKARQLRAGEEPDLGGAVAFLSDALELAERGENPELRGEVAFELAETLVSKREVSHASQHYNAAQERFREVQDSLPVDLRDTYEDRQRRRFRSWKDGGSTSVPISPKSEAPDPLVAESPAEDVSHEDALKSVNQLLTELSSATSLPQFLGKVVEDLLRTTGAEVGFVLSLAGRNLSVLATRRRGGDRPKSPGKILCLSLIQRALKQQHPLFVDDAAKDPAVLPALRECGLEAGSLSISPFLESDGKKGALYLVHPRTGPEFEARQRLLVGPFLNILPMAFLQIPSSMDLVAGS